MMEIYADDNGFHRWFHRIVWPHNMLAKMIRDASPLPPKRDGQ